MLLKKPRGESSFKCHCLDDVCALGSTDWFHWHEGDSLLPRITRLYVYCECKCIALCLAMLVSFLCEYAVAHQEKVFVSPAFQSYFSYCVITVFYVTVTALRTHKWYVVEGKSKQATGFEVKNLDGNCIFFFSFFYPVRQEEVSMSCLEPYNYFHIYSGVSSLTAKLLLTSVNPKKIHVCYQLIWPLI